jgi:undecaprenyl-diphosphatase
MLYNIGNFLRNRENVSEILFQKDNAVNWEFTVLDWLQETARTPLADFVMPVLSSLSDAGILWILLGVALLCFKATRRQGAVLLVALLLEFIFCNGILKPVVARLRPYDVRDITDLLVPELHDFSFPSGHTAVSFAAAASLYFTKSRLAVPAVILACAIAFSRLYLYVHFPTDVLAGLLLGILSALLSRKLCRKLLAKHIG